MKGIRQLRMKSAGTAGMKPPRLPKLAAAPPRSTGPNDRHEPAWPAAHHDLSPEQLRAVFADEKANSRGKKPRDAYGRTEKRSQRGRR